MELEEMDRAIIRRVSADIGESLYPFREIALELKLSEDDVLERLKSYTQQGIIRRFGAILRHQVAGYEANGMSVWNVPGSDVDRVGRILAACPEISHCYERPRSPDWPYNLYGMIHGHSRDEVLNVARKAAEKISIDDYDVLFSVREFKKTSMVYG